MGADAPAVRGVRCQALTDGFRLRASLYHPVSLLATPGLLIFSTIFVVASVRQTRAILDAYGLSYFVILISIGLLAWIPVLMLLEGTVTVTVRGEQATVVTGFGSLGLRRRFRWSDVTEARLDRWFLGDWIRPVFSFIPTQQVLLLDARSRPVARFGCLLTYRRRAAVVDYLRQFLPVRAG